MDRQRNTNQNKYTINQVNIMNIFRELWEQHALWTRSFIISTAANLGDLDLVTRRLLENPEDFANVLSEFYGNSKANEFSRFLKEHLTIAASIVNNAKANKAKAAEDDRRRWFQNADDIAEFLADINPYWNQKIWQTMLYDHLRLVENEAKLRLKGQYAEDIKLYDEIEGQALNMADMMSMGIIKQFNIM